MAQVLSPSGVPTAHLFGNTIGAVVLGWGISSLIFGMLCIQVWTYYQRYPNDHWSYKVLVLALWALEALHQIFVGHIVWFYLVENFGSSLVFLRPPVWTLSAQTLLGSLIGTIVKICFGMRVWKFSPLSLGMVTDVFTAASLSYFLHKMRTGFKSAAVLASYNLMPSNLIYIALYFILSKLFANSCVGTLNTRRFIHGKGTDREEATIPTFLMVANTLPAPPERTLEKRNLRPQRVSITSETDKAPQYAQGW
ncbi:hypothetical protein EDB86DRAFT_220785 [Lactarius hatsudake]|nr:hypothetical protein EDB86DRAFT_220785 [Lactarius hatsudake]